MGASLLRNRDICSSLRTPLILQMVIPLHVNVLVPVEVEPSTSSTISPSFGQKARVDDSLLQLLKQCGMEESESLFVEKGIVSIALLRATKEEELRALKLNEAQLTKLLAALHPPVRGVGVGAGGVAEEVEEGVPAANPRERINMGLMVRLALVVMILAQGGSSTRLALLCFGAFCIFAWQAIGLQFHFGQAWGGGQEPQGVGVMMLVAELHDLFVPLLLSLMPTWSTHDYMAHHRDNNANQEQQQGGGEEEDNDDGDGENRNQAL